jgi:23S rRNA (guanosine2251-2'-O)-methyltransferase
MQEIAVLLHNIRSAHNVGSIFRTADAAGISKLYLSGYTPTPRDRFNRPQKDIAKTALGAQHSVAWEYAKSPEVFMTRLKNEGWAIVGVEQDMHAIDYRTFKPEGSILFIFGNEVLGISSALRKKCDTLIEISMRGSMVRHAHHPHHSGCGKESLNVSVAAGIILFQIRPVA